MTKEKAGSEPESYARAQQLDIASIGVPAAPAAVKIAGYRQVIGRLTAKDPEQRFQSAGDLFAYIAF